MTTDDQGKARIRTSDAERERVAETLRNAVTDGRLTLDEGDERLGTLYATRFRDELPTLVSDLPTEDTARCWGSNEWSGRPTDPAGARRDGSMPGGYYGAPPGSAPPWAFGRGPGGPWARPGSTGPGSSGLMFWHVMRILLGIVIILGLVALLGGHFLWPLVPLFFLTIAFVRFGAARCGGGRRWPDSDRPRGPGPGV